MTHSLSRSANDLAQTSSATAVNSASSKTHHLVNELAVPTVIHSQPGLVQSSASACAQMSGTASPKAGQPALPTTAKLPYQATHRAELLHLQADIEILLQQLQALKQQRQSSDLSSSARVAARSESPALV